MPKVYVGNLASSVTSRDLQCISRAREKLWVRWRLPTRLQERAADSAWSRWLSSSDVAVAFSLLNNSELKGQKIRLEPDPSLKNGKARNRA